jgi:tetratricopeptide (TPR) repeat protein
VWSSYSARQAAQLIGLPESAVRSLARAGLIGAGAGAVVAGEPATAEVPLRIEFRDLAALRTVKTLVESGVPLARVRRELIALHRRLPPGRTIAEVPLEADAGHVRVRGEAPDGDHGGQLDLPLLAVGTIVHPTAAATGTLHAIPVRRDAPAPQPVLASTADEWFDRALSIEETDLEAAIDAYRRCLRLRPDSTEAWINLGRLFAENGDSDAASECFGTALKLDPADATALYNLGVVAQDAGREKEAIGLYVRSLELDPALAEAHYNLATIFDQRGESQQAIRHINEYRKLTR